jgi:hypothetical protein
VVLVVGVFAWFGVELARLVVHAIRTGVTASVEIPVPAVAALGQWDWVAIALVAALASWVLARRLAGSDGLI